MRIKKTLFFVVPMLVAAFNIAVIATLAYFFFTHRVIIQDINQHDKEVHFKEMKQQRPEIHNKYRQVIKPLHDKNRDLRLTFMKELASPNPDYDKLQVLNQKIQAITGEISKTFYNEMIETRKTLTKEEAKRFYGYHVRMMLNKFDLEKRSGELPIENPDGGGMLSPHSGQGRFRRKRAFSEDN